MSSIWGKLFQIATWGESHGKAVGVTIDGCPAGLPFSLESIQAELARRKPGQSKITTQRQESDQVEVLSGVFENKTTGTPISLLVWNEDQKSKDYENIKDAYRPSHADFTYDAKYGHRDYRGGGRSSARETIGRVAAGTLAKQILQNQGISILAWVQQISTIKTEVNPLHVSFEDVESNIVRCPDPEAASKMEEAILKVRKEGDSLGGIIQLRVLGLPAGLGEPIFDRVEAELAKAMLSIPATKGFEIGSGFSGSELRGSQHNDLFDVEENKIVTSTNHSGGVQGGITNGMPLLARIAFKPTATVLIPQNTLNNNLESTLLQVKGRHDPCVVPRAVVIVEAMAALTLVNFLMEHQARKNLN